MVKRRGHNEGSIRQRADGSWEARLTLPAGKRASFYGKTRKEASDKLRQAQRELDAGLDFAAGKLTFSAYLAKWLETSVKPSVKTKTYEGYESIVRVRIAPHLGTKMLPKVTALDLQSLYTTLDGEGLSARSVSHTHHVLHRAFSQAIRWGMIGRNPCDGVTPPSPGRREMKVLDQEQAAAFMAAVAGDPHEALYALAISTGMRQGELLGLRWADVDLAKGRLTITRSLQRQRKAGLVYVDPKTGGSRRSVVLTKRAIEALKAHRKRQIESRVAFAGEWKDEDLVFCRDDGGPLDPSHQTATFKAFMARKKLPAIRFHDLRHSAATLLLAKGVHPKVVSEMLGHATITLTLDTYSHLLPTMHDEAATVMESILSA